MNLVALHEKDLFRLHQSLGLDSKSSIILPSNWVVARKAREKKWNDMQDNILFMTEQLGLYDSFHLHRDESGKRKLPNSFPSPALGITEREQEAIVAVLLLKYRNLSKVK